MNLKKIQKVTLGECASIIPGVLPQIKERPAHYVYPAIQPGQITPDGLANAPTGVIQRDTPCSGNQFLLPGDVLLKRLNPDCTVVFGGSRMPTVASANLFVIRPGKLLDSNYLAFLLEKSKLMQQISQLSGVGTTVAALTAAQIARGIIPLPPLDLQRKLGELWSLSKTKEHLLRSMLQENDRLLRSICGKID